MMQITGEQPLESSGCLGCKQQTADEATAPPKGRVCKVSKSSLLGHSLNVPFRFQQALKLTLIFIFSSLQQF